MDLAFRALGGLEFRLGGPRTFQEWYSRKTRGPNILLILPFCHYYKVETYDQIHVFGTFPVLISDYYRPDPTEHCIAFYRCLRARPAVRRIIHKTINLGPLNLSLVSPTG